MQPTSSGRASHRVPISQTLTYKGRTEYRNDRLHFAEASFVESLTIAGDLMDPDAAAEARALAVANRAAKRAATILGATARLLEGTGHAKYR